MDRTELKETSVWALYEKGQNYLRQTGVYFDTDRNYRMYGGDQWYGVKLGDVEPVQNNFIKPIVKYKVAVIHDNLYAINYSSQNYGNRDFQRAAVKYSELLNRYAARVWEAEKMDFKGRRITKDSAINGEGVLYVDFDLEKKMPRCEVIRKNDIYYGDENSDDIQSQPYILIRRRLPVTAAVELALEKGMSEDKIPYIVGDSDTSLESGDDAKLEVDDKVTLVYKMYRREGTVRYSIATRYCDIVEEADMGLRLYPVAHFCWEEKVGSARGEGEVKHLIPNQIEVNRTEVRRILTVMYQAFPQTIVDVQRIQNPQMLKTVGGIIEVSGQYVDDVHKVIGKLQPAQMSPDVRQLLEDLIQKSRDLAGAGESATGSINPETASGRAILAVQQASQAPMTEQRESYKNFIEDVAKIWLEYITVHSDGGIDVEEKVTDPDTGEEYYTTVNIPQSALAELKAVVKIDVTPRSVYDKFAQERTIENLLMSGLLTAERVGELSLYGELLEDDSVAPKIKILEAAKHIKDEQRRIAEINARGQRMQQYVNQLISGGVMPEGGAGVPMGAQQTEGAPADVEEDADEDVEVIDDNPDDN